MTEVDRLSSMNPLKCPECGKSMYPSGYAEWDGPYWNGVWKCECGHRIAKTHRIGGNKIRDGINWIRVAGNVLLMISLLALEFFVVIWFMYSVDHITDMDYWYKFGYYTWTFGLSFLGLYASKVILEISEEEER